MYTPYFNAIKTLINTNLNTVKTVDWYNNQYNRTEDQKAVSYPAVYVEFQNVVWDTAGKGLQTAKTMIRFHIVMNDVADSPVALLNLSQELHKILHKKSLINGTERISSALVRKESELMTEYDQLKIFILGYDTMIYDLSTMPAETPQQISVTLGQIQ